ncbi:ATP-grasp domain-containing protein [Marinobacter sediminum]|uniref:carboxylate--amine ligase n=1 Tax=Marinobacter sediminum TaxID=256323 RepID=UPI00193A826D|nr:ATP-grasp domain-containing protein [Marinobacter sediminum]
MSQFPDSKILVLDGNQRASLAAVRSLGTRGLWIAVGESSAPSLAGSSRFNKKTCIYPDPHAAPRAFFETLLRLINELEITFLLPITETTTYVVLRYQDELPSFVTFPFPSEAEVEKLANKNNLFEYADRQGTPIPATVWCQNRQDGLKALPLVKDFPIVLKPFKSKILQADRILSTRVLIANDSNEAESQLQANAFFDYPFTIQSYVQGTGQGIFALFNKGEPVCYFSHRRLREKPPGGGVSVLSESAQLDPQLKMYAEKLLIGANWHGVAMVEFRVSPTGTGYLMEVNPRFWGSLQLAIDSGIDFPWWLYLVSTGQEVPEIKWRQRRVRWILGDIDRLFIVLKSPTSTYSWRKKLLEVLRFLRPGLRTRHEVNRWDDPLPFWFEIKQYIRALKS